MRPFTLLAAVFAAVLCTARPALALTATCQAAIAAAAFPDVATLQTWNQAMADFGPRPTAGDGHVAFVRWLVRQLRTIPGMTIRSDRFTIRRQQERSATLDVMGSGGAVSLPTAGAIPYALLTGRRGVDAPVVYLPPGTAMSADNAGGRIVVRDHVPSNLPYSLLRAVAHLFYDPGDTYAPDALYERDYLGYQGVLADIRAATAAGAAGLVVVHEFPLSQLRGHYEPYEGQFFNVPAVTLGVDEGSTLKQMATADATLHAHLVVTGGRGNRTTRNVIATLPGASPERIVVGSHTDGMNAVWDNGPIAMLALARHFAAVPVECRPRTLEFGFTTAHLYLSRHGAARYADQLKSQCDTVALAIALEHLGARELIAVPRDDGPGRTLVQTGLNEFLGTFVTNGTALRSATIGEVTAHDLRRTGVIPFIAGVVTGEGGAYQARGIPTVALIAGPWSLYNPTFEMEVVDPTLLHEQVLALRDLVVDVQELSRDDIGGGAPCTPGAATRP